MMLSLLLAAWLFQSSAAHDTILAVHGSGTTNPSKCYWAILEQFEARAKQPIRVTYRAVGSTTGIEEFLNEYHPSISLVDFASGDLPIATTDYNILADRGVEIVHLPVLLGAVSIFHSVPGLTNGLNLNACLLARIFTRDITQWSHPDIVARNPALADSNLPINVVVRTKGSSSTDSTTKYLGAACPEFFPEELVGDAPIWPAENQRCDGSSGVTACIQETPGTIGYIDSGHGVSAGLDEVMLENVAGTIMNSQEAAERNGILAAEQGAFPESADADFGSVSLVNRPGVNTWPIVQMTYIYARKNLTYIEAPEEQSLVVAFLKALLDEAYVGQCRDSYGFTLPSPEVKALAEAGIKMIEAGLPSDAPVWIFEHDTMPINGTGQYVLSDKRAYISDVERAGMMDDIAELQATVAALEADFGSSTMRDSLYGGSASSQDTQLTAALTMASLSFVFWMGFFLSYCVGWMRKP